MDHVIVKEKWSSKKRIYHTPDPENPDLPKCIHKSKATWMRRDPALLPHYKLCKDCQGGVNRSHKGPELGAMLSRMDPQEVP